MQPPAIHPHKADLLSPAAVPVDTKMGTWRLVVLKCSCMALLPRFLIPKYYTVQGDMSRISQQTESRAKVQNAPGEFVPTGLDLENAPNDASSAVECSMLRGGGQEHPDLSPTSQARRWLNSAHLGPNVKELG
jgi:hypothetical protein